MSDATTESQFVTDNKERIAKRSGLPGWAYFSEELLDLEASVLFRTHWQFVCHVNTLKTAGDYVTLDIAGERAFVIRGQDGNIRGFHNLCRHRGSRVVGSRKGNCAKVIVCPFHGWSYNLDGSLRGIAKRETFPELNLADLGLKPLDLEIWIGLIFIRFLPGPQPRVADLMMPLENEIRPYEVAEMIPAKSGDYREEVAANWKAVRDIDNEGYHVPQAHPALHDLYGQHYMDEPYRNGVSRTIGRFNPGPGKFWSVRNYKKLLPVAQRLPESHRQAWLYVGLFPNVVFGFYPESAIYYQEIPVTASKTIQLGGSFKYANEDRQSKVARYLSGRIDRETSNEDRQLTVWACEATKSSAFDGIILSDLEIGVRSFHDHLRLLMPVLDKETQPASGSMAVQNQELVEQKRRR